GSHASCRTVGAGEGNRTLTVSLGIALIYTLGNDRTQGRLRNVRIRAAEAPFVDACRPLHRAQDGHGVAAGSPSTSWLLSTVTPLAKWTGEGRLMADLIITCGECGQPISGNGGVVYVD